MKRSFLVAVALATLVIGGAAQEVALGGTSVADKNQEGRNLVGQVMTKSDAPLTEAVVYLKNTKTLTIKSFITEKDGGYRFPSLSPNIDYEVYAQFNGKKSDTKTVSQFDNRPQVNINLKVDTK